MLIKINKIFLSVLLIVLIIDPSDLIFHLKVPLIFLVLFVWILDKVVTKQSIRFKKDIVIINCFFLLVPIFGIISGLIQNSIKDPEFAMGVVKSFSIFFLVNLIIDSKYPIYKNFNWFLLLIPLIIIPCYFTLLWNVDLFKRIAMFFSEKNETAFSPRNFYGINVIMLYYRTSALLVFPLSLFLYRFLKHRNYWNLLLFFICFITLFLSGTRGNIIATVLITVYLLINSLSRKRKFIQLSITVLVLFYGLLLFIGSLSLGEKDSSQEIKSGHFSSYITLFETKPSIFIFGQGLGSEFFSTGLNQNIVQSELTYLDLVRIFGVPGTLLVLLILTYPLVYMYKKSMNYKYTAAVCSYYGYLFIVGSNPLLISSTGIIAVIIMYSLLADNGATVSEIQGNSNGLGTKLNYDELKN